MTVTTVSVFVERAVKICCDMRAINRGKVLLITGSIEKKRPATPRRMKKKGKSRFPLIRDTHTHHQVLLINASTPLDEAFRATPSNPTGSRCQGIL